MSLDLGNLSAPVANVDDLVGYIKGAERPPDRWLIGVEHEKIGVRVPGYQAVPYHGAGGIRELLDAVARSAGGTQHKHKENGQPIALLSKDASVTLEPGGQLELSGAPARSLREIGKEIEDHLAEVRKDSKGISWLAAGYRPFGTRDEVPWMPKGRYAAMRKSLGPRGRLALDMMLMTATVQANLDWSDERDLAEKVRAASSASPIVSALFANSSIIAGRDSGWLDFRYQVWRECDPDRCGLLEPMFRDGWGYESYVDWALRVPMLFVRRGSEYLDARGQTFGDWLRTGRLRSGGVSEPHMGNWVDHLTTLFPEVRVKRVLELRGADMVPPPYLHALAAVWVGLLYDTSARQAAWDLTKGWTFAQRLDFQADVARRALDAQGPGGRTARDLARELVFAARAGLSAWAAESGDDVRGELDPLEDVLARGTLAERALVVLQEARGDPAALVRFWQ